MIEMIPIMNDLIVSTWLYPLPVAVKAQDRIVSGNHVERIP